ncbi:MAG: hypothetical protein WC552_05885 [Candidatus Omnitrophota bacterium]
MKKLILTILFLSIFVTFCSAQTQKQISLSTSIPSPIGIYDLLRIVPRAVGLPATPCDVGTFCVVTASPNVIRYCKNDRTWGYLGVWGQEGNNVFLSDFANPNIKVIIGGQTPELKLTLETDGGIIAKGALGSGQRLLSTGADTKFIWYPRKAAIRAGQIENVTDPNGDIATGAHWNDDNIGLYSVAFGSNTAALDTAGVVSGGRNNYAFGNFSVISGGGDNLAGFNLLLGGGSARYIYSTVAGGKTNWAGADYSTISGGRQNQVDASYGVIGGGDTNRVHLLGSYSTIGGGKENWAGGNSFVSLITGAYCTVGGGWGNLALGDYSTVGGGTNNKAEGQWSTIAGGGASNSASGRASTITGGAANVAAGEFSSINGGNKNTANGQYAFISGGGFNQADGEHSWVGGYNMASIGNRSFVWGYSPNQITVDQPDVFIIDPNNQGTKVGIGMTTPDARLHIAGNIKAQLRALAPMGDPFVPANYSAPSLGGTEEIGYDIAELFNSSEEVETADVVIIDETSAIQLAKSKEPYSKKVIGVVSEAPAILFEGNQLQIAPAPGGFTQGTKPPVALAGRVLCKVTNENGPIERGDLLTSSSTPGHAMKATDKDKAFGAVIGKALEPFAGQPERETTGKITIMVTLQ